MGRSVFHLDITYIYDQSGWYTAFYTELPGLIVQCKTEKEGADKLRELVILYFRTLNNNIKQ